MVLTELFGVLAKDGLQFANVPGESVANALLAEYLRRRAEAARDILFDEIRHGNITAIEAASEDDTIAVILKYLRVAQEGAARVNLRLLAKAIAGRLQIGRLVADEFLADAAALSTLTRDEIIVIAALCRATAEHERSKASLPDPANISTPWVQAEHQLAASGMNLDVALAAATSAQRTGLIYTGRTLDDISSFCVGPLLRRLAQTVDFQDALRREGVEQWP